jgi:hypothetical protein
MQVAEQSNWGKTVVGQDKEGRWLHHANTSAQQNVDGTWY